jgi:hypothetical protein
MEQEIKQYARILRDSGIIYGTESLYGDKLGCIFRIIREEGETYDLALNNGKQFMALKQDCLRMTGKEVFHSGTDKSNKRIEKHYELWPGTQALDVMKATLSHEEFIGFLKGNILKYQLRMGNKESEPSEKDLQKINTYKQILKESL